MEMFQEESAETRKTQKEKDVQKRQKEIEVHLTQFSISYENFREIVPKTNGTFEKSDVKNSVLQFLNICENELNEELKEDLKNVVNRTFHVLIDKLSVWDEAKDCSVTISPGLKTVAAQKVNKELCEIQNNLQKLHYDVVKDFALRYQCSVDTTRKDRLIESILKVVKTNSGVKKELSSLFKDEISFQDAITKVLGGLANNEELNRFQQILNLEYNPSSKQTIDRKKKAIKSTLTRLFPKLWLTLENQNLQLDFSSLNDELCEKIADLPADSDIFIESDTSSQSSLDASSDSSSLDLSFDSEQNLMQYKQVLKTYSEDTINRIHAFVTNKDLE